MSTHYTLKTVEESILDSEEYNSKWRQVYSFSEHNGWWGGEAQWSHCHVISIIRMELRCAMEPTGGYITQGQRGSGKVMPLQIRGLQLRWGPRHHSAIYSYLVKHRSPKWMVKASWLSSRSLVHSCPSHLSADETASDCTEEAQSTRTNPFPSQSLPSWLRRNRNSALLISYFSTINLQFIGDQNLNKLVYFLPTYIYLCSSSSS